jgi:hypothetical protein
MMAVAACREIRCREFCADVSSRDRKGPGRNMIVGGGESGRGLLAEQD